MMSNDTTRIADLPENITMQMNPTNRGDGINTSYSPMDIHPNPYGHPPPSVPNMPTPSSNNNQPLPPTQIQQIPPQQQQQQYIPNNAPSLAPPLAPPNIQSLPARDIPQEQSALTQDPQIKPNYVPPVSESVQKTAEYMKQYDSLNEQKIKSHHEQKAKEAAVDDWMDKLQLPVLVGLLFFIFQMPIIDTMIFQKLAFLSIYQPDGNFNTNGLIFRSLLFGLCFMALQSIRQMGDFSTALF